MKSHGILHPELSYMVASCGHTDYIVLADKGFPVPYGIDRINLGILDDLPTVIDVLRAISLEMTIDCILVTHEMSDVSSERLRYLKELFPKLDFKEVSHLEFKEMANSAGGIVKTGDTCPYANLMVVSG